MAKRSKRLKFCGELSVSLHRVYLRPTVGQSAHKFFENTRDCGLGAQTMVSARLPKKFLIQPPNALRFGVVWNVKNECSRKCGV
jgi:hypothetical protein